MARGDHIRVRRAGGMYSHHGIDLGDGTVIHFSGEPFRRRAYPPSVCLVSLEEFLRGGEMLRVDHGEEALDAEQTIARATAELGKQGYDLWWNNCEHFARCCKTGLRSSRQVKRALKLASTAAAVAVVAGGAVLTHRLARRVHFPRDGSA